MAKQSKLFNVGMEEKQLAAQINKHELIARFLKMGHFLLMR
jgi:hypothetical protein